MLTQALLRDAHAGTGGGDGHVVADGGGVVGGSGITYGATTSKAAATTTSTTTTSSTGSRAAAMAAAAAGWVPAAAHSASLVDSGGWSWVRNPKAGGAVPVRLQVTAEGLSWLPLSGAAGAAAAQVYDLPMSCIVGATVGGDAGAAGSGGATDASSASTAASAGRTTLTVVAFPHVVGRDGAAKPQRYRRVLTFTRIAAVDAERLADSAARHVGATLPAAAALGGVGASEAAAAEWAAVIGTWRWEACRRWRRPPRRTTAHGTLPCRRAAAACWCLLTPRRGRGRVWSRSAAWRLAARRRPTRRSHAPPCWRTRGATWRRW